MTDNIKKFEDLLSSRLFSEFGSNYDDPEAGLYGLMEAMTCEKELGWRKDARRIIVLCTDNTYHSAGDGKIVGAFQPHDMKCHLHKNNSDLIFDYPSVSQINRIATKENFLIIFAAVRKVREEYTALAKAIHGAKYAELDEKDKSNIVEIIQTVYLVSISFIIFCDPNTLLRCRAHKALRGVLRSDFSAPRSLYLALVIDIIYRYGCNSQNRDHFFTTCFKCTILSIT